MAERLALRDWLHGMNEGTEHVWSAPPKLVDRRFLVFRFRTGLVIDDVVHVICREFPRESLQLVDLLQDLPELLLLGRELLSQRFHLLGMAIHLHFQLL